MVPLDGFASWLGPLTPLVFINNTYKSKVLLADGTMLRRRALGHFASEGRDKLFVAFLLRLPVLTTVLSLLSVRP